MLKGKHCCSLDGQQGLRFINQSDLDANICDGDNVTEGLYDDDFSGSTREHCGELPFSESSENEQ